MKTLYTIGHSTKSEEEFLTILQHYEITHLIDVRTIPGSKKLPWFNEENLTITLKKNNISYLSILGLGGFRKAKKDSINMAWKNLAFRGYADYMQTDEFKNHLKELNTLLTKNNRVAIMCAEALPWRCHRSLIADAEVIRNINVIHIMSITKTQSHKLTAFAKIKNKKLIYYPDLLN